MAIDFEMEFAKNFLEGSKRDGVSIDYPELEERKYRTNYDRIVEEIIASNPIEDNKNYMAVDKDEIIYRAIIIVKYLLGDAVTQEELFDATNLIVISKAKNVLDGYCMDITDMRDGKRHDVLSMPKMNKTVSVVCLVGVLIHHLERTGRCKTYNNYRDAYTMSFISEGISANILDKENPRNNLLYQTRGLRLDAIKFQQNALCETEKLLRSMPCARNMPEFESMHKYESSRDYAYLRGFINQVCLLNRYLDDEKTFLKKLNEVFKGEIMVPDILDYYGIDIKKREITEEVIEVVKKYK